MEFRFELPNGYSKEDWKAFFQAYYRVNSAARWGHLVLRVLCAGIGILNFFLMIGILVSEDTQPFMAIVPAALFVATLVYAVGFRAFLIRSSRRRTIAAGKTMTVTITADGVTDQTGGTTTHYQYDAFYDLFYCQDRYVLFLGKHTALILPERCREGGSSPELRCFLEEKTGKAIKTIH